MFGDDFDEEVEVGSQPVERCGPSIDANDDASQPAWAFEYEVASTGGTDLQEESLQPYHALLDTLSSANLEAMTVDHFSTLDPLAAEEVDAAPTPRTTAVACHAKPETPYSRSLIFRKSHQVISDDRDLLVIEDDLPGFGSTASTEPTVPAAVQPYKQLFSKLRG